MKGDDCLTCIFLTPYLVRKTCICQQKISTSEKQEETGLLPSLLLLLLKSANCAQIESALSSHVETAPVSKLQARQKLQKFGSRKRRCPGMYGIWGLIRMVLGAVERESCWWVGKEMHPFLGTCHFPSAQCHMSSYEQWPNSNNCDECHVHMRTLRRALYE